MHIIQTMRGVGEPDRQLTPVPRQLQRVFDLKGVVVPTAGERLTAAQLDKMLEGASTHERIEIKINAAAAGILPEGMVG